MALEEARTSLAEAVRLILIEDGDYARSLHETGTSRKTESLTPRCDGLHEGSVPVKHEKAEDDEQSDGHAWDSVFWHDPLPSMHWNEHHYALRYRGFHVLRRKPALAQYYSIGPELLASDLDDGKCQGLTSLSSSEFRRFELLSLIYGSTKYDALTIVLGLAVSTYDDDNDAAALEALARRNIGTRVGVSVYKRNKSLMSILAPIPDLSVVAGWAEVAVLSAVFEHVRAMWVSAWQAVDRRSSSPPELEFVPELPPNPGTTTALLLPSLSLLAVVATETDSKRVRHAIKATARECCCRDDYDDENEPFVTPSSSTSLIGRALGTMLVPSSPRRYVVFDLKAVREHDAWIAREYFSRPPTQTYELAISLAPHSNRLLHKRRTLGGLGEFHNAVCSSLAGPGKVPGWTDLEQVVRNRTGWPPIHDGG